MQILSLITSLPSMTNFRCLPLSIPSSDHPLSRNTRHISHAHVTFPMACSPVPLALPPPLIPSFLVPIPPVLPSPPPSSPSSDRPPPSGRGVSYRPPTYAPRDRKPLPISSLVPSLPRLRLVLALPPAHPGFLPPSLLANLPAVCGWDDGIFGDGGPDVCSPFPRMLRARKIRCLGASFPSLPPFLGGFIGCHPLPLSLFSVSVPPCKKMCMNHYILPIEITPVLIHHIDSFNLHTHPHTYIYSGIPTL